MQDLDPNTILPLLALTGAIIVVLLYLYFVKGMFRSKVRIEGPDVPSKLRNIKKLADSGKYGAAITLAYRTFEQMCGTRMGSERMKSETAREYLERVVQVLSFDSAQLEEFVSAYEEARFSHHEMKQEDYQKVIRTFTDIYPRIDTGIVAPGE